MSLVLTAMTAKLMAKAYLITASKDHAEAAVKGGFIQAGHGKKSSIAKLRKGDGIVIYSPATEFEGGEKCQKITAVGEVSCDEVYRTEQNANFKPYRVDVLYNEIQPKDFRDFLDLLSFVKNKKAWGMYVRNSIREIPRKDFRLIRDQVAK